MQKLLEQLVAKQFCHNQTIIEINPLGNGLINDTFLVKTDATPFILQRINRQVFPNVELVMENLLQLNQHIQHKNPETVKITIPAIIKTQHGTNFYQDEQQECWRALQLIDNSESRETIKHKAEAEQTGYTLGHFHYLLSDLAPHSLHDTLPGFHITPQYLQQYHQIASQSVVNSRAVEFEFCQQFISNFSDQAEALEKARQQGQLSERVIHGDPKLNNFLFANNTNTIISLIDLDTVKPGLVHYDIGDSLRSCCHKRESNQFDIELCEVILSHYLQEAGHFFTAADYDYLYTAIELIPFELGLRFFTDFLNGDKYFKVNRPEQNLFRASDQFALCADIARQRLAIEKIIKQLS